jgi:aspartate-semialdehyde dehydrogenase
MRIAVVGATGLVGSKMLQVLEEKTFPITELFPVASAKSLGKKVNYCGKEYSVIGLEDALSKSPDIAIFSAGGSTSSEWAPKFAAAGTYVIDNSSTWRMDEHVPLVIPEVNPDHLTKEAKIIANPNCSTIQMVLALKPLHDLYKIKRIVVSTYQSVTGTGQQAVKQLFDERKGQNTTPVYPHKIDLNVLPHIDIFLEDGYTKEEQKMMQETKKIIGLPGLGITATTVRIPTMGGHSESLNVEFEETPELSKIYHAWSEFPGIIVEDDPSEDLYPMPINAHEKDEVFVGRLRLDPSQKNTINFWVVADNLRKGAATNAVQIAELLVEKGWFN